ncbi:hypothetical protein GYMLUDRAFT_132790, partial [Collybiopsis luxurians FD-317 M1]
MEFFSQFDCKIVYVAGDRNSVADALSRPVETTDEALASARHPYAFCPEDEDNDLPILLVCPDLSWSVAHHLAECCPPIPPTPVAATLEVTADSSILDDIHAGYMADPWCKDLQSLTTSMPLIHFDALTSLWYIGDCLIIPHYGSI